MKKNTITAEADRVTIWIYEAIESGFAQRLRDAIQNKPRLIELRINSPGGVVAEAAAAFSLLKSSAAKVTVMIDGVAASSASFLAMSASPGGLSMAQNALLMIHNPWTSAQGDAAELRRTADALDKHREILLQAYGRSRLRRADLEKLLDAETWLTAKEALDLGFIDQIHQGESFAACAHAKNFPNLPKEMIPMSEVQNSAAVNDAAQAHFIAEGVKAEAARRDGIEAKFAHAMKIELPGAAEMKAACLADVNCTADAAGLKALDLYSRGAEPLGRIVALDSSGRLPSDRVNDDFSQAVTDALLVRHGVAVKNAHPASMDVMNMTMLDVAKTLLSRTGKRTTVMSPSAIIKAAMTTGDLPAILENVAHKALMIGFDGLEAASHRIWTRAGSLSDFKAASRVAMSEAPGLSKVLEGAEYTSGALYDAKEVIQLETFGKIVTLSRQMIVNDDLGSIARLPLALGQSAARKEADLVYGLLTQNPTMRDGKALFHADHGNVLTQTAFSVAGIGEARMKMRVQKGLAGESALNIVPSFLIVPAAMETVAEMVLMQITPNSTSEAVPVWIRNLTLVVDPRLDAASDTTWYMAAKPDQFDTIEVAQLDGAGVSVETEQEFFTDNTSFKVRLDVGAAVLDWRGLVRVSA